MTNNKISTISNNYAKALIEIAQDKSSTEQIKNDLKNVIEAVKSSKDLNVVMNNSAISTGTKISIIEDIFANKIDKNILNLLKILVENNRFNELESIYNSFCQISDHFSNKKNVEIISSIDLKDEIKEQILEKLQYKLHCSIIPSWQIDKDIISGLVFKFEDYVIDTSVKAKLESLSKNILR